MLMTVDGKRISHRKNSLQISGSWIFFLHFNYDLWFVTRNHSDFIILTNLVASSFCHKIILQVSKNLKIFERVLVAACGLTRSCWRTIAQNLGKTRALECDSFFFSRLSVASIFDGQQFSQIDFSKSRDLELLPRLGTKSYIIWARAIRPLTQPKLVPYQCEKKFTRPARTIWLVRVGLWAFVVWLIGSASTRVYRLCLINRRLSQSCSLECIKAST